MNKARVAIAGLGAAARTIHLPALRKLPNVEIVGGFDPNAIVPGVPIFASVDGLIGETRPDYLVIATPPHSHAEIAKAGISAGCHIFCEKPLTNDLAEADELAELARDAEVHVVVNSQYPFMPIHAAARREIGGPRFGDLLFLDIRQSFVVTAATEAGWRGGDMRRTFKEFGTHVLDLCKFFFDERPLSLHARMPTSGAKNGPDYLCIVELGFSRDRTALIVLDRLSKGRHRYLDVRLVGEKATIESSIGGRLQVTAGLNPKLRRPFADLEISGGGSSRLYCGERSTPLAKAPLDIFADATARLFQSMLDAVAQGTAPPNNIDDARHTLALLYEAYDDAGRGSAR